MYLCPLWLWTAGRSRSAGSSSTAGAPLKQEEDTQQRAGSQIEWPLGFFRGNKQGVPFLVLFRQVSKIDDRQGDGIRVRPDRRHGVAFHGRERRVQRIVPTHDCSQSSRERADVQGTAYPDCGGQIIGAGPRFELVNEPEPPLCK
jgi:hypothetical protein